MGWSSSSGWNNSGWSVSGAAPDTTPVAGTVIHLTSPDDLTNIAWDQHLDIAPVYPDGTAPDSTNTASSITSTAAGVNQAFIQQTTSMTGGVTYSISGYFKPVSGATWLVFGFSDDTANATEAYFNLSGSGTVGSTVGVGDGIFSDAKITALAGGWYFVSYGGSYTATHTTPAPKASILFADSDGDPTSSIGQAFLAWHVGQ